ncbi:unnamed protein product, partial [Phaeothamnion confervicola]
LLGTAGGGCGGSSADRSTKTSGVDGKARNSGRRRRCRRHPRRNGSGSESADDDDDECNSEHEDGRRASASAAAAAVAAMTAAAVAAVAERDNLPAGPARKRWTDRMALPSTAWDVVAPGQRCRQLVCDYRGDDGTSKQWHFHALCGCRLSKGPLAGRPLQEASAILARKHQLWHAANATGGAPRSLQPAPLGKKRKREGEALNAKKRAHKASEAELAAMAAAATVASADPTGSTATAAATAVLAMAAEAAAAAAGTASIVAMEEPGQPAVAQVHPEPKLVREPASGNGTGQWNPPEPGADGESNLEGSTEVDHARWEEVKRRAACRWDVCIFRDHETGLSRGRHFHALCGCRHVKGEHAGKPLVVDSADKARQHNAYHQQEPERQRRRTEWQQEKQRERQRRREKGQRERQRKLQRFQEEGVYERAGRKTDPTTLAAVQAMVRGPGAAVRAGAAAAAATSGGGSVGESCSNGTSAGGGGGAAAKGNATPAAAVPMPATEEELWLLPRGRLPEYLSRCRESFFGGGGNRPQDPSAAPEEGFAGLAVRLCPFLERAARQAERGSVFGGGCYGDGGGDGDSGSNSSGGSSGSGNDNSDENDGGGRYDGRRAGRSGLGGCTGSCNSTGGYGGAGGVVGSDSGRRKWGNGLVTSGALIAGGLPDVDSSLRAESKEDRRRGFSGKPHEKYDDAYLLLLEVAAHHADMVPHALQRLVERLEELLSWGIDRERRNRRLKLLERRRRREAELAASAVAMVEADSGAAVVAAKPAGWSDEATAAPVVGGEAASGTQGEGDKADAEGEDDGSGAKAAVCDRRLRAAA